MQPIMLRWQNFRGLRDTGWIIVKPLTIIIGPNNAGKTSIHAPLLLLKQTIQARDHSIALMPKGNLVNLGTYNDMVREHEPRNKMTLGIRFHYHDGMRQKPHRIGDYPPGECQLEFSSGANSQPYLSSYRLLDVAGRPFLSRASRDGLKYTLDAEWDSLGELPGNKSRQFDGQLWAEILAATPEHFLFTSRPLVESVIRRVSEDKHQKTTQGDTEFVFSRRTSLYVRGIDTAVSDIRKFLRGITYIGPLRECPQRRYELSGEKPQDVGTRGEYAPELIMRDSAGPKRLLVDRWLRKFGFGVALEARACSSVREDFYLSLRRQRNAAPINLADTGFGISQVLPLVVQGFMAPPSPLLIAEQPEIHLNPRLQATLAELFCAISKTGTNVMIETHSEHLVLKLRDLIAAKIIRNTDVALYYVERHGNESRVRPVPIEPNGHIMADAWPKGFFEDSLRNSLSLASRQATWRK